MNGAGFATRGRRRWLLAALPVALLVVGCGSGGSGANSSGTSTASAIDAPTRAAIDAAYQGSFHAPPATSPRPRRGLNIWFIPAAATIYPFTEKNGINDVAKALGWHVTLFDGKFSPDTQVTGLRQAIAAKADGIILYLIDCATVKSALQAVNRAGIPVVAAESYDCNQPKPGQPVQAGERALFQAQATYVDPKHPDTPLGFADWIKDVWGYQQGLGVIAGTNGNAKIVDVRETDSAATLVADDGARRAVKEHCPHCSYVDTVEITGADYGSPVQQKVASALAQFPNANAVIAPTDASMINISAAVRESGRAKSIWAQSAEGGEPVMTIIRNGGPVNSAVGFSVQWEVWSLFDALNRLTNGEKPNGIGFPSGNSQQLVDKTHNLPPAGMRYQPPIDFQAAYLKAWGVAR